jgi:DNA-binding NtrC family response regulator
MVYGPLHPGDISVLVSEADWAWPQAATSVFEPRGIQMLLARRPNDLLEIVQQRRIQAAIVDADSQVLSGLGAIRIIRAHNPLLPCILLACEIEQKMLKRALELDVFSVLTKPVDFELLTRQLDRLFVKRYDCDVFSK